MSLKRFGPGVWADPSWTADRPGTFAVIVGVSAYAHLGGGDEPAPDTYGLAQLGVSAFTAHRFFTWLRSGYYFEGAPLVRCWLLLAPTPAELAVGAFGVGDYAEASYDNIEAALGEWFQMLESQTSGVARVSRSFFFFSGHGMEVSQDKQILLPSDWLRPPNRSLNRAISTSNLTIAFRRLEVERQFFFVDACRNGSDRLRSAHLDGSEVLNEFGPELNNPRVNAGLMYATASGSQAWQQPTPDRGPSLFGQALLEALGGKVSPHPDDQPPGIWYPDVFRYVTSRVSTLLLQAGTTTEQPIRGQFADVTITQHPGQDQSRGSGSVEPSIAAPEVVRQLESAAAGTVSARMTSEADQFWMTSTRLLNPFTGTDLGPEGLRPLQIQRDAEALRHWITIEPGASRVPIWLELTAGPIRYGALLPGSRRARYEIALRWSADGQLLDCRVDLSEDGAADPDHSVTRAAHLWRRYRSIDPLTAAGEVTAADLTDTGDSTQAPLRAVVAALVLLRAGHVERLHDCLAILSHRFPDLPDGPALWAEHQSRLGRESDPPGVVGALLELAKRWTLPFTAEAFGYAAMLTDLVVRTMPDGDVRRSPIAELHERLSAAARYQRGGGLFLVLAGPAGVIGPALVVGRVNRNHG